MGWDALKPYLALMLREALKAVGTALLAHGYLTGSVTLETFIGFGMTAGGIAWSWWLRSGMVQLSALLKKLTDAATDKAAVQIAKAMAPAAVTGNADAAKSIVADAAKVAVALLIGISLLGALATPSFAQVKLPLDPLGLNSKGVLQKVTQANLALFNKITSASVADLEYATAMATSMNTSSGDVRAMCWRAIIVANQQAAGVNLKAADGTPLARPDPRVFTDVETLAEIMDAVSPQGRLFTSCAGAAQLAKATTLQFISAAIVGVAGIAALPAGF